MALTIANSTPFFIHQSDLESKYTTLASGSFFKNSAVRQRRSVAAARLWDGSKSSPEKVPKFSRQSSQNETAFSVPVSMSKVSPSFPRQSNSFTFQSNAVFADGLPASLSREASLFSCGSSLETPIVVQDDGQSFKQRLATAMLEANECRLMQKASDKDLLAASAKGRVNTVTRLLSETAADPNCATRHGMTPLHYAAMFGNDGVVFQLLAAGADPFKTDFKGRTAQDLALERGHSNIAEILERIEVFRPSLGCQGVGGILSAQSASWPRIKKQLPSHKEKRVFIEFEVERGRVEGPLFAPYTVYIITFTAWSPSSMRRSFVVTRRFSQFFDFFQTLMKNCRNQDLRKKLESLEPKKCMFSRFSRKVVDERAHLFQQLLTEMSRSSAQLPLLIDFLSNESVV